MFFFAFGAPLHKMVRKKIIDSCISTTTVALKITLDNEIVRSRFYNGCGKIQF